MSFECDQKNALPDACHRATYLYAKAAREFSDKVGVAIGDDLQFFRVRLEQARKVAHHLREVYGSHITEHVANLITIVATGFSTVKPDWLHVEHRYAWHLC